MEVEVSALIVSITDIEGADEMDANELREEALEELNQHVDADVDLANVQVIERESGAIILDP